MVLPEHLKTSIQTPQESKSFHTIEVHLPAHLEVG